MIRSLVSAILVVCLSAISFAAEAAVIELKCIGTASNYPHSGDLIITYEENPDGITGEMAYEGQVIEDGKLNKTNFTAKLIGNSGNSVIAQREPIEGEVGYLLYNYVIDFETGHFYFYLISLEGEEANIVPSKTMNCAIKE